ncbi:MAG TPA: hypothetical protein VIR54_11605 [Vicinamibacterales bacterium]|jgi:hypothetical protein
MSPAARTSASASARGSGGQGYSGTPLAKKLGIGTGHRVWVAHAPANYKTLLSPLPDGVTFATRASNTIDVAHVFTSRRRELEKTLRSLRSTLRPDAAVWVSWPKKSSKVPSDITEDVIREITLPMGFVDIKVCAVDDTWSGLKLVVRKELRQT